MKNVVKNVQAVAYNGVRTVDKESGSSKPSLKIGTAKRHQLELSWPF